MGIFFCHLFSVIFSLPFKIKVSFRPPEIFFYTKRKIYNALALKMLLLWIHLIIFTKCMLLSTKENDVFDNEEIPEDFLDHGKQ